MQILFLLNGSPLSGVLLFSHLLSKLDLKCGRAAVAVSGWADTGGRSRGLAQL